MSVPLLDRNPDIGSTGGWSDVAMSKDGTVVYSLTSIADVGDTGASPVLYKSTNSGINFSILNPTSPLQNGAIRIVCSSDGRTVAI